jgi:hypothetical protein
VTPESIPGQLIPTDFELTLHLDDSDTPLHQGPVHHHHELLLTNLSEAA